jgi:hypothetical protein
MREKTRTMQHTTSIKQHGLNQTEGILFIYFGAMLISPSMEITQDSLFSLSRQAMEEMTCGWVRAVTEDFFVLYPHR